MCCTSARTDLSEAEPPGTDTPAVSVPVRVPGVPVAQRDRLGSSAPATDGSAAGTTGAGLGTGRSRLTTTAVVSTVAMTPSEAQIGTWYHR